MLRRKSDRRNKAGDGFQIPRQTFIWLLAAVMAVIVPHVTRLPLWLSAMCLLCIGARILIWQGRLSYPGNKTKLVLVGAMAVLVPMQFGRDVFSTDSTVGVLLVGITLKLLEMHRKRDVLMVLYLSYFTVVAEFIYSQSIPTTVYMSGAIVAITCALMSLHQSADQQKPLRTLRLCGTILLQSVPLMLAFFLLFPRLSPLWSVPLQNTSARTGLSDNMTPGDIGDLTRSAEVAFRVRFQGEPPPYEELYWRALTLDEFDGRSWTRQDFSFEPQFLGAGASDMREWFEAIEIEGEPVYYNVIMEPTYENWVYTLMMPLFNDDRMMMRRDYEVNSIRRISQRYTYDARSYFSYRMPTPGRQELNAARRLPPGSNPQARAFAEELRAQHASDVDYMNAVLQHFRDEEFFYTLSPDALGEHPVDDFLFATREGFCEHYASSFSVLMRAAGIPARVVTGYQGGEFNPYDGTLTVRQYDAHAWVEVWLPDRGWLRVDPTAAVAPERISQGSDVVLQEEESFMDDEVFTLMRFRSSLLLNDLRLRLEMIDYAWNRFVLNYDQDMQFQLFSRLFGEVTRAKILAVVVGFMALMVVFVAFTVFRKGAVLPKPPATVQYLRLCDYLATLGYARHAGETPQHFLERVLRDNPQWRAELEGITRTFTELAFASREQDPHKLRLLQRSVSNFRMLN